MSFVNVVSHAVYDAAGVLAGIGSELNAASAAAAAPTIGLATAAQDEISTAIAALFGEYGQQFQALSAQAQELHDGLVGALNGSAAQYQAAEAAAQQVLADPSAGIKSLALSAGRAVADSPVGQAVSTATGGLLDVDFSKTVWTYQTPLGSVVLTVYGDAPILGLGTPEVTAGSLAVSPQLAFAIDAVGAPYNAAVALKSSNAVFAQAMQTGNPIGAATALLGAPGNVGYGFLYGQSTVYGTTQLPSSSADYTSAVYQIPLGGLLAPGRPVVLTLYMSDGTATTFPLSGIEFGGLVPALEGAF